MLNLHNLNLIYMKKLIYLIPLLTMVISCSHKTTAVSDSNVVAGYPGATSQVESSSQPEEKIESVRMKPRGFVPKATAFRMNGDFSDNVAITLDSEGNLIYFPAPTDITADSKPLELVDGWWLNRQGIGQNSVFTTYTFAEYSELPAAPSPEQLKKAVIPGSRVTQIYELPYPVGEAYDHISEINTLLKNQ